MYILLVCSNEICSACTNVIPEIKKEAANKLNLRFEDKKVQLLYFPFYKHTIDKLYIKLSMEEKNYRKASSSDLKAENVLLDANQAEEHTFGEKNKENWSTQSLILAKKNELKELDNAEGFFSESFIEKKQKIDRR